MLRPRCDRGILLVAALLVFCGMACLAVSTPIHADSWAIGSDHAQIIDDTIVDVGRVFSRSKSLYDPDTLGALDYFDRSEELHWQVFRGTRPGNIICFNASTSRYHDFRDEGPALLLTDSAGQLRVAIFKTSWSSIDVTVKLAFPADPIFQIECP